MPIEAGARVKWIERRRIHFGHVVRYGRASKHPWDVYFVRPESGMGYDVVLKVPVPELNLHPGEAIMLVEVHADRIAKA
jgi:hypothetical protein